MSTMNLDLLDKLGPLQIGAHNTPQNGACIMEAVSFVAGEPWSDHPVCACPVLSTFLRAWNDALQDDERDALLRPLIPRLIDTRGNVALERRRSLMAADWLVREHTPAWLRLAGLTVSADALASLSEITDTAQIPGILPAIEAAQSDANAAWAAAWDAACDAALGAARAAAKAAARAAAMDAARDAASAAAWNAAWDAALDAARDAASAAAWNAAWNAARAAARAAALDAALDAARGATWDAAWAAAWDAARGAAWEELRSTKLALQQSALRLIDRMIAA